jgi:hypothetical protein
MLQAALLLGLLGFAYGPPVRSNAVRELLLLAPDQLEDAEAKLARLRSELDELMRQEGGVPWRSGVKERCPQSQAAAAILEQAAALRTCTNADCTNPFCLGNR